MSLNITYGVSTWLWTSPFQTASIRQLFPKISEMGFDAVEIAMEDPTVIDIREVKSGLEEYNLKPIVCGAFGPTRDLTHEEKAVHKVCFDYIERCLDYCAELGVSFFAGPLYSAVGKARQSRHLSI